MLLKHISGMSIVLQIKQHGSCAILVNSSNVNNLLMSVHFNDNLFRAIQNCNPAI